MTATLVTALVCEATRKMASVGMAAPVAGSSRPKAWRWATLPARATSVTAPPSRPSSTYRCMTSESLARRAEDSPTISGRAIGSGPAKAARASAIAKSAAITKDLKGFRTLIDTSGPRRGGQIYLLPVFG